VREPRTTHTRKGGRIRQRNPIQIKTQSSPNGDAPTTPVQERGTISRELASLALAWAKQGGQLKVRQREQLRRAVGVAARIMSWEATRQNELEVATRDIVKLARSGTRSIRRELDREAENKRTETVRLRAAVKALREVAESDESIYPVEFNHSYTARSPSRGLVTKNEPLTLADADEARAAADNVDKRAEAWDKLRVEMLAELKLREQRWAELSADLSSFADASRGTIREVLAILT